ncbi:MAG TPA: malate:quinone oxidoreductase, partial [Massilia sp.]|nr:malate:quinone oxidoreductase [Massilia sp.]
MRKLLAVAVSGALLASCGKAPAPSNDKPVDVVLIGAGVMSATLGTMLTELQPDLKVEMF